MTISVQNAIQIFNKNPQLKKWVPVQNFKNAIVKYEKADEFINKIVTRNDGTEIIGQFKDGKLVKTTMESLKGKFEKDFAVKQDNLPQKFHFDKSTTITTPNGDQFSRYEGKENGILDIWAPKNGLVRSGKMNALFQEFLSKVKPDIA